MGYLASKKKDRHIMCENTICRFVQKIEARQRRLESKLVIMMRE